MKFFKKPTEIEKIISGCIKNNGAMQSLLYHKFKAKMFAICLRYSSDYHSAEDILQDGFVKVFKNIHKFRGEGSFEGWMRRVFVNTAIEHFRKKTHLYPILDIAESGLEEFNSDVFDKLAVDNLMDMIQTLSPGYRIVFNMYVIEGYSHKEISNELNISEGTSKSQLSRARQILKGKVEQLNTSEKTNYAKTIWK